MAWLAVDIDGEEYKYSKKPERHFNGIVKIWSTKGQGEAINLISGSIEKLTGKKLTWKDEPIKI